MNAPKTEIQSRESDFHDAWASGTDINSIDVVAAFESPTAVENRFILSLLLPLRGKRVLDVGAGLGESSVYFALQGAFVTCTDLSAEMVRTAIALGERHGVKLEGVVSAAENLNVQAETYDIAYVANTIHHVGDKAALFGQLERALKPGGLFVSIDPLRYNPIIEVYRRMATAVRSEDESPLSFSVLQLARGFFTDVHHREFWLSSLVLFLKYYLIDRVHPNEDRYWKRILHETEKSLWWWLPLRAVDERLGRIPLLRRMAWNMVMWGRKP